MNHPPSWQTDIKYINSGWVCYQYIFLSTQIELTHFAASGKPHNIICSSCHKPNNLVSCESCCRSYHASCLSPPDVPTQSMRFYCPACSSGQWSRSPSTVGTPTTISPEPSRSGTPIVRSTTRGIMTPPQPISLTQSTRTTPHKMQALYPDGRAMPVPNVFDPHILTRAQEFLHTHGGFPESQEFSADLLLKLGSMMAELDLHRERVQELASENTHLRQDNANIRAYLDSNLMTGMPIAPSGGDLSSIQRPPTDTTGKSWDRIVMDLI